MFVPWRQLKEQPDVKLASERKNPKIRAAPSRLRLASETFRKSKVNALRGIGTITS